MIRKSVVVLLLISDLTYAKSSIFLDARLSLKKWGLAYCVGENFNEESVKSDAGTTRGAYFQLGRHNDESAYAAVRKFFDNQFKADKRVAQETGKPIILERCLDIYESASYLKLIKAQDKYLNLE